MTWRNIFKQPKSCKKSNTRWWDLCMSDDEKKGVEPIFSNKDL